ncbi:hypothetical protein ACXWPL_09745, partial [Streptococcus pyogenes]
RRRGLVLRSIGVLVLLAFLALLVYGLMARSPDTSIDDSLAQARPIAAPAFELAVLQRGSLGPRLTPELSGPLRDGQIALRELR